MERMSEGKESGTLLGVGTAYLPVKEIKGEFYVKVSDFTRCMDGIRIEQEADRKHIEQLEEENKTLKLIQETNEKQIQNDIKERDELREENKKLKSDLTYERTMLDNVRAEYESSQDVIKKLKEDVDYRHHRAMVAERQVQHSLGGDDEEGLYD